MHVPKSCTKALTQALQVITYVAVEKGMEYKENNGEVWYSHNASIGVAAVGKKAYLLMKEH